MTTDWECTHMMEMDAEGMGLPPEEWFNPSDGLAAVQALSAHLRANPKAIAKAKEMLSELDQVTAELTAAARHKVEFHFALVP
jgi:hypothetical protein